MGTKPKSTETPDFRTRTGAARRVRTRGRIVAAALALFDDRGVAGVTIDDVRSVAGLARGTFYNYFPTYEAMLCEIAGDITAQLNREQDEQVVQADVGIRIFQYMRYFMLRAASDRACSEVLVRVLPIVGPPNPRMAEHARATAGEAVRDGTLGSGLPELGIDIGYGVCAVILRRALARGVDPGEITEAALMLLRAQGMPEDRIAAIRSTPLPTMPPEPLRSTLL
jgi:AcrR family transcriptional regulator